MKKYFILLIATAMSICAFAQDVIITKDSKKIDAKILEVSKSEIKYKEADNLEGPTFVLEVEDINSIIYSNGKVVLYNNQQPSEKTVQEEPIVREETKQTVIVDFGIEPTSNPLMYRFPNLSTGASDFRWDFGDGTFSFAKDAAMKGFEKAGTYTVTLTATVGDRQYVQRKVVEVGGSRQAQEDEELNELLQRSQEQLAESGAQLRQSIQNLVEVKNSYALDIKNTTKYPYRINLDGHILGDVNPYKTERFIVSVEIYGRMQAVQTSGYTFSPTIKEFKIPRQQKQTACTIVIK